MSSNLTASAIPSKLRRGTLLGQLLATGGNKRFEVQMLSILYPHVLSHLRDFNYGLLPFINLKENKHFLVIKTTKEAILTAKTKNQFKVYLIKDGQKDGSYLGIISAFFDDHDEPLTMMTPLFSGDEMLSDVSLVFSQQEFEIYFFDENNYELLGVKGKHLEHLRFQKEMSEGVFSPFNPHTTLNKWEQMGAEFGRRTLNDDHNAFTIDCTERLYPDDFMIMDLREKFHGYNDDERNIAASSLVRDADPGPMQEKDIARLLLRLVDAPSMFVNPIRTDTGLELTDLMVITKYFMFFVQAKDSPNTQKMLNRPIARKRQTIRNQIKNASAQMGGALKYARDNNGVTIKTSEGNISIALEGRQLVGLIVVKELFDDDYKECSTPILKMVRQLNLPVGLFDYSQLNVLTLKFASFDALIDGLYRALDIALEHEQFPKSVHSGAVPN